MVLTLWARLALGAMWTAAPTVKQEHQLRTSGPYAITRHPIYIGLLGMLLGSGLLAGAGRWILYFPIYFVFLQFKMHAEERLMLAEFPEDYPRYRQRVPQFGTWPACDRRAQGCQQLGKPSARRCPDCLVLAIFPIGAESWLA